MEEINNSKVKSSDLVSGSATVSSLRAGRRTGSPLGLSWNVSDRVLKLTKGQYPLLEFCYLVGIQRLLLAQRIKKNEIFL